MESTRLFIGLLVVDLAFGFVLGWASARAPDRRSLPTRRRRPGMPLP